MPCTFWFQYHNFPAKPNLGFPDSGCPFQRETEVQDNGVSWMDSTEWGKENFCEEKRFLKFLLGQIVVCFDGGRLKMWADDILHSHFLTFSAWLVECVWCHWMWVNRPWFLRPEMEGMFVLWRMCQSKCSMWSLGCCGNSRAWMFWQNHFWSGTDVCQSSILVSWLQVQPLEWNEWMVTLKCLFGHVVLGFESENFAVTFPWRVPLWKPKESLF